MAQPHTHAHAGLDVQIEREGPCVAKVRFTVTPEETRRARSLGLQNYGRQTRMKGFRPGKVPAQILEKQFGAEVDRQLVQHFCQHALETAVRDNELRPAVNPRIDLEGVAASTEEAWGHEFEILLRPEIELREIEGLRIESPEIRVGDEELEATIADVRRQLSVPEPAGDEGLPADGMAVCKVAFIGEDGGDPLFEREGVRMSTQTPPPGVEAAAFADALTGAKAGEERTFDVEFGDDFPEESARGQKGTCRVTIDEAFRIVPPTEERMFEEFEVEDDEALRRTIRERIEKAKREQEERRLEHELLERVIREHPIDLPQALVDDQAQAKVAEMQRALEAQGIEGEELDRRVAEEQQEAYRSAEHALRAIYLMEEIARVKELQVTEKHLVSEFEAIASRNQVSVEDVRKYYQEERLLQQLGLELLERNVRSFLRRSADIQLTTPAD